jgi:putative membrane protein
MFKLFATTATVALLALGGPALAQTSPSTQRPAPGTAAPSPSGTHANATAKKDVDRGDRKFMEHAAEGSTNEVALGKLAQQKAQDPQVKQLAETIVKDHEEANQKLSPIAQAMGVDLSKEIAKGQKKDLDDYQKLSGADFDKKYVDAMVKDHKKDVKEFDDAAKNAKNPELKSWAGEVAPKLHNHLQMAEAAQKAMQPKTSSTSTPRATTGSSTGPSTGAPATGTTKPAR